MDYLEKKREREMQNKYVEEMLKNSPKNISDLKNLAKEDNKNGNYKSEIVDYTLIAELERLQYGKEKNETLESLGTAYIKADENKNQ